MTEPMHSVVDGGRGPVDPIGSVRDILAVEEVGDAEFFAGDLFRRRFRNDPPDFPRHFVVLHRASPNAYHTSGYIHYTPFEDSYLCGGMVIDDRVYRRMPAQHRHVVREAGGIAEFMLRETFARLADAAAIFGYVGDRQAEVVDRRVGFAPTQHRHLMVVWQHELPEEDKVQRLRRVAALGPF